MCIIVNFFEVHDDIIYFIIYFSFVFDSLLTYQ